MRRTPVAGGGTDALDVTLVEGRVVVRDATGGTAQAEVLPAVDMSLGERLRLVGRPPGQAGASVKPKLDRPRVDQVLAWKRGEAIFENASLPEAIAEMNRYTSMAIELADPAALSAPRVSRVFRTGDNVSFARAVVKLHGLVLRPRRSVGTGVVLRIAACAARRPQRELYLGARALQQGIFVRARAGAGAGRAR